MPRNGSGTYNLPAGNPVVTGTTISSTWANTTLSDIGTALTQSIASNGQTTPTANLPMGGFKHTNVAVATATTDYLRADQALNSSLQWLTSVSGTNAITASASITPAAYAAGQTYRFVSAGANTGAVTLNVSGLGNVAVTKNGTTALVSGDIPANSIIEVTYDGAQFQLTSAIYAIARSGDTMTGALILNGDAASSLSAVPARQVAGIVGSSRSLTMAVATASATATLTADEVIVETALGGIRYCLSSFSKSINLATTGAGGMDTGTAPVSGYVAVYAIYNPTTATSALLGVNATSAVAPEIYGGANMPSGYTASALVSVWPSNSSSQFVIGLQYNRTISIGEVQVLNSNTNVGGGTSLSISSAVPKNAKRVGGSLGSSTTSVPASFDFNVYMNTSFVGLKRTSGILSSASNSVINGFSTAIQTAQTIYYAASVSTGTPTHRMFISEYDF